MISLVNDTLCACGPFAPAVGHFSAHEIRDWIAKCCLLRRWPSLYNGLLEDRGYNIIADLDPMPNRSRPPE